MNIVVRLGQFADFVAEGDGKIVGYIHFYTDRWDGYEKVVVSRGVDCKFSSKLRQVIENELEEAFKWHN